MDELHYRHVHYLGVALCTCSSKDAALLFSFSCSVLQLSPRELIAELEDVGANLSEVTNYGGSD